LEKEMPVQPTNDVLTPAFELLSSTVNDFFLRARPCLGAALKPRLYDRGFSERAFHFNKFGDFLRAAERAGYVKLSKTSGGDIAVLPASISAAPAPTLQPTVLVPVAPESTIGSSSLVASNVPLRVRPDLWNAFNSHSDNWVYDPDQDRAFRADAEAWGMPARTLIPVPSGRDRIAEWMRAFTNQQEPTVKAVLPVHQRHAHQWPPAIMAAIPHSAGLDCHRGMGEYPRFAPEEYCHTIPHSHGEPAASGNNPVVAADRCSTVCCFLAPQH
jgi:hypothetical protein